MVHALRNRNLLGQMVKVEPTLTQGSSIDLDNPACRAGALKEFTMHVMFNRVGQALETVFRANFVVRPELCPMKYILSAELCSHKHTVLRAELVLHTDVLLWSL